MKKLPSKNRHTRLAVLLLVAGLSVNCAKEKTGPVDLALRLQKGEEYKQITTSEMKMQMGAFDPKVEIYVKMVAGITQKVENVEADGTVTVKVTHDWLDMYGKGPGGEKHFDTRALPKNASEEGLAISQIPGKSFEAVVSPRGELLSVSEPSQVFELIEKSAVELMHPEKSQAMQDLPAFTDEEKKQILQPFAYFPYLPVKVGDRWQTKFQGRHLLYFDGTVDFVLKHLKGGIASIDFTLKASPIQPEIDVDPSARPKLKISASGEGTGQIKLKEKNGAVMLFEKSESYSGEGVQTVAGRPEPIKFPVQVQKSVRLEDQSN